MERLLDILRFWIFKRVRDELWKNVIKKRKGALDMLEVIGKKFICKKMFDLFCYMFEMPMNKRGLCKNDWDALWNKKGNKWVREVTWIFWDIECFS